MKKLAALAGIVIVLLIVYKAGQSRGAAYAFSNCRTMAYVTSVTEERLHLDLHFLLDGSEYLYSCNVSR